MPVRRDHRKSKGQVRETMTAGVRTQEIAAMLGVDPRTVEQYLSRSDRGGRAARPRTA